MCYCYILKVLCRRGTAEHCWVSELLIFLMVFEERHLWLQLKSENDGGMGHLADPTKALDEVRLLPHRWELRRGPDKLQGHLKN